MPDFKATDSGPGTSCSAARLSWTSNWGEVPQIHSEKQRNYELLKELFWRCLSLSEHERSALLDLELANLPLLKKDILVMMANHEDAERASFLAMPFAGEELGEVDATVLSFRDGEVIDDFELLQTIGEGNLSKVYLARQKSLDRKVALKVSGLSGSEGQTLARLEHPAIVRVFSESILTERRLKLINMQFIDGVDFSQLLQLLRNYPVEKVQVMTGRDVLTLVEELLNRREGIWNSSQAQSRDEFQKLIWPDIVAYVGIAVLEALDFAHGQGILHLDVKPANILLSRFGQIYLSDFNVAQSRPSDALAMTVSGGTPAYMSPEQSSHFTSRPALSLDGRSDIFSLGITLWELFALSRPTPDARAARSQVVDINVNLTDALAPLIERDRVRRPQTALAAIEVIRAFQTARKIAWRLPPLGPLLSFTAKFPVIALILIPTVPQMVAAGIIAGYSLLRPGGVLNWEQKRHVLGVLRQYSSLSYPLGYFLAFLVFWPIVKCVRQRSGSFELATLVNAAEVGSMRRRALWLPVWRALINVTMWFPAIPIFIFVSYQLTGHFNVARHIHYVIATTFGLTVAITYSTLFNAFVVLRVFLPGLLTVGELGVDRSSLREELKVMTIILRILPLAALFIPLLAAVTLLIAGPDELSVQTFRYFQGLLVGLIAVGGVGFAAVLTLVNRLRQMVAAFQ